MTLLLPTSSLLPSRVDGEGTGELEDVLDLWEQREGEGSVRMGRGREARTELRKGVGTHLSVKDTRELDESWKRAAILSREVFETSRDVGFGDEGGRRHRERERKEVSVERNSTIKQRSGSRWDSHFRR